MATEILIKGMVCERCIAVIKEGMKNLGHEIKKVSLGKLTLATEIDQEHHRQIGDFLQDHGFELISSRQERIVKQTKEIIHEVINGHKGQQGKVRFSLLLSEKLNMNYDSISELFREMEDTTLEKYIITKRIEKVKELLVYTQLTLTEIAYITGFSSINHLSSQFKQITGLSPTHFRQVRASKQKLSGTNTTNL